MKDRQSELIGEGSSQGVTGNPCELIGEGSKIARHREAACLCSHASHVLLTHLLLQELFRELPGALLVSTVATLVPEPFARA